jgi:hypothetical protein
VGVVRAGGTVGAEVAVGGAVVGPGGGTGATNVGAEEAMKGAVGVGVAA